MPVGAEAAVAIDVRAGCERGLVSARFVLGQILAMQGETDLARDLFEVSLADAQAAGDDGEAVMSRRGLLSLALEGGDAEVARALLSEAQAEAARLGHWMTGVLLGDSANLALLDGDRPEARRLMHACLGMSHEIGNANAVAVMGWRAFARREGGFEEAVELLAEAGRIFSSEGDGGGISHVLTERAMVASLNGDHSRAAVLFGAQRPFESGAGWLHRAARPPTPNERSATRPLCWATKRPRAPGPKARARPATRSSLLALVGTLG